MSHCRTIHHPFLILFNFHAANARKSWNSRPSCCLFSKCCYETCHFYGLPWNRRVLRCSRLRSSSLYSNKKKIMTIMTIIADPHAAYNRGRCRLLSVYDCWDSWVSCCAAIIAERIITIVKHLSFFRQSSNTKVNTKFQIPFQMLEVDKFEDIISDWLSALIRCEYKNWIIERNVNLFRAKAIQRYHRLTSLISTNEPSRVLRAGN